MARPQLVSGTLFALAAGLMWGLVFIGPLLLPGYPAALQSFGRYVAFGLIALPLAWADRRLLSQFTRSDWREAARLGLVGNIVYYLFLASAIQRATAASRASSRALFFTLVSVTGLGRPRPRAPMLRS